MTAPSSQTTGRTPETPTPVIPLHRSRLALSADDLRTARLLEQAHQLDPQDAAYRHLAVAAASEQVAA